MVDAAIPTAGGITLDPANLTGGTGGVVTAGGGGVTLQQTNIMQPGTDVQQFANVVLRRGFGDYLSDANTLGVSRNGVQAGVNDQWVSA
jgi:hypothetical protein